MKRNFFHAAVVPILLYGYTTWTLTKRLEKKLDGNYTRMLRAILNKSRRQHPTRHELYGHLSPITKIIQARWTRHAGHCWRSRDELISDVLLWTPTYHYHHHVVPQARISLTLSYHFSLSFIASGRSLGLHPASSHSCCMYVRTGRPAFARPYVGVHRSTSLMNSSLLLQQCHACPVRLTWIVFVMGDMWGVAARTYWRMLRAILKKSPTYDRAKEGRPARTYIEQILYVRIWDVALKTCQSDER